MYMNEVTLTNANFETEVLKSDQPVLVDFYADWCGPCKMQGPIVHEVSEAIGDKAKVGKLNVDENQEVAQKFNVMSIPTLIIFKNGQAVETMVGVQTKDSLIEKLNKLA
ncbi:MAG: thioredoxin [Candidatus Portnoybacteria bacterium CG10_big_fil_rev_8_21_14_0_10_36_7]|uniref:Thioredoxin n=1 Tax=Candidatus Portnoybacteria bacterium CG10_big_fil_rev_8_21_14_0_10_36_7 TaxID=1974812 RepID=A0A2M8KDT4_9BACT|nr:MAG: thioredoxin [Candidatus Portnoybacteria bacterium CG10_big_fil_rev_8_21_14_0_10_36_7]